MRVKNDSQLDINEVLRTLDCIHNQSVFYALAVTALDTNGTIGIAETGEQIAAQIRDLKSYIESAI